ncbi:WhiB family transcriptional regulator [Streptomyces sp. NPDC101132]|uniref:WhiB family transcriptional regulator n=1 Tax=Streptomyces sp. NPDC101132 TaxID=3366110 RepID=UPI00380F0ABD
MSAWQLRGACAGVDPDLWFPDSGVSSAAAKRICSGCPVREECQAFAFDSGEHYGVWGGLSEKERQSVRRPRSGPRRHTGGNPPAPCGTVAAYMRHKRNGEPVDYACVAAYKDHYTARNARRAADRAQAKA